MRWQTMHDGTRPNQKTARTGAASVSDSAFCLLPSAFRPRPARRRGAFTLAECLIAMTVLAVAVVGIASVLAATYQQSAGQADSAEALALARMLMEEIAAKPIAPRTATNQPGWPTQTNRAYYDTIDDFHGYTDSSAGLKTTGGIEVGVVSADGAPYTRRVTVTDGAAPVLMGGVPPAPGDFKAVTVTVDRPGGPSVSITQVFSKTTAPS